MTADLMPLSDALLYEGSLLYPYRRSALKNRRRFPFGALYPPSFCRAHGAGDAASLRLECLVLGDAETRFDVQLRFLQAGLASETVREVRLSGTRTAFVFGSLAGRIVARTRTVRDGVMGIVVRVSNRSTFAGAATRDREDALASAIASPQLLVSVTGGAFVSLTDPPADLRDAAAACRNRGTWPVLVGPRGSANRVLAAPIILSDYPEIAPESAQDFFDATDIDELLTLRVLTLTDEEKHELAADPRARALLQQAEADGPSRLGSLHGARRPAGALEPRARVRLRPRRRADILDLVLQGRQATVQSVERDLEGRVYVVVSVDDDPGQDLGAYGHRFYFHADEVEPV